MRNNITKILIALIAVIVVAVNIIPNNVPGQLINSAMSNSYFGNVLTIFDVVAIYVKLKSGFSGIYLIKILIPHIASVAITLKTLQRTSPLYRLVEWIVPDPIDQDLLKKSIGFIIYFGYAVAINCFLIPVFNAIADVYIRGFEDVNRLFEMGL